MGGLTRSWDLVTESWRVLTADKALLIFPILSAVCTLIASALFIVPGVAVAMAGQAANLGENNILGIALLFVFYLVTSAVALFFNVALAAVVARRLRGEEVAVGAGFRLALAYLPQILGFAVISAVVGVILSQIERRGMLGEIVRSLIGAAWSIATFLVVPVMVVEGVNPFSAIKRSVSLLRQTWGAQIVGNFGMGLVFFLLALPGAIPAALALLTGSMPIIIVGVAIAVLYWALLGIVGSALGQIFRVAVYYYAVSGDVPAGFDRALIAGAFRAK